MKKLFILMVSTLFLVNLYAQNHLTKDDLNNLVEEMKICTKTKDVSRLSQILSSDLKVMINFQNQDNQKMIMDKDKYLKQLALGWSLTKNYEYKIKKVASVLSKDNKSAIIKMIVDERVIYKGNNNLISTTTDTILEVKLEEGIPKIKNVLAKLYFN